MRARLKPRLGHAAKAAILLTVAAACHGSPARPDPCPEALVVRYSLEAGPRSSPYDSLFPRAGAEFGVPADLLRAVGWVETRWQMVRGTEEFPGRPAAFGVMALRGEALARGAALAGVTAEAARTDPVANIRAAAALLAAYAGEPGADWGAAAARYSGIDLPRGRDAYLREVNRALGVPSAAATSCPPPDTGAPDYAAAVWRPSPNFNQRPPDSTGTIHAIIIHTCEGNYTGCWSWLTSPISQVSAHYVVNEDGGELSQLVLEPDRAWHIAASYDCTLNGDHDCRLDGVQSNHFTVGIEHAGFASQDSFPAAQLDASAALVCDITRDRAIPRDWRHILAHGQLQPENRTDPGPNWPWIPWVHRIQAHCGEIVVDDSSEFNDAPVAAVAVPAAWPASDSTPDYYGGGYRWAPTQPAAADGAVFSFRLDSTGVRKVEARWTSGSNRSTRAEFAVVTAAGDTVAKVPTDQTAGGGAWHELGTWTFPAGWNRVVLLRRDASGSVVVADAVRVRR